MLPQESKETGFTVIGFYDYTLILTLLGLVTAVFGMIQAVGGHIKLAILCLILSGVCDAFDGAVARTKKNRTDDEKSFGIQLDSLCDMVAFGAFPALICYLLGASGWFGRIAVFYYCVCSVIRLSFYNVKEINRLYSDVPEEKYYYGLPVTSITVILPVFFILKLVLSDAAFTAVLVAMLLAVGTCFILNFRIRRPKKLIPLGVLVFGLVLLCEVLVFAFGGETTIKFREAWRCLVETFRALN